MTNNSNSSVNLEKNKDQNTANNTSAEFNKYLYNQGFCCEMYDKLLFSDIKMHDYLQPLKLLIDYYKTTDVSYYLQLREKYESFKFGVPQCVLNYNYDLDEILLQYLQCFCDVSMIVYWTDDSVDIISPLSDKILNNNSSDIHCYKKLQINNKQFYPLVYQLSWHNYQPVNFDYIKRRCIELGLCNKKQCCVNIIMCNNKITKNISDIIDQEAITYLSITNRSYVLDLVKLFFNKNSMRLLQYQRIDRLLFGSYNSSLQLLMSFKNWLYQEILPIDQIRFMIFSSGVLYTLGIRNMRDIDLIANWGNTLIPESVTKFLVNPDTKFPFVDVHIRKNGIWFANDTHQEYLSEWFDKEWPSLYDSPSMEETIINPKYHYYYCGIKLISMQADITRRIKRNRAAAFADLIALIMFTSIKIPIIKLDSGCWKEHIYYEYTEAEIKKMLKTVQYYMKKKYHVKISEEEIRKYIEIKK